MEGPTPVSALLHAATMVTAGIFLVLRCSCIYEYSAFTSSPLIICGGFTIVYGGICALIQYDLKKIIAYSTCSQIGYMFLVAGLSAYNLSMMHLLCHAFFKALLFLSAGVIIHGMFDEQDMRKMNNLYDIFPFVHFSFLVGSFAIMGFPFLTGFYSKDLILEFVYSRYLLDGYFAYLMGMIGAILTAAYSTRLLHHMFIINFCGVKEMTNHFRVAVFRTYDENPENEELEHDEMQNSMLISMVFLIIGSVLMG